MATYSGSDKRLQYLFQHGGGGSLEDLDDVEITNPTDGDALVYDGEEEKWVNGEGGGGNANEQVLTKAEYDALTEEQKMNNTTYYINDADTWTSKEVQPVIYSTEEREIGVWIDGRPLYQKTLTANISSTVQWIDTGVNNTDTIVYSQGYLSNSNGITILGASDSQQQAGISTIMSGIETSGKWSLLYRASQSTLGTGSLTVTIRYTKTSDTPGSGIYTPQGQLAVHYSTDEHVIGTWIDGSTLYEKSIVLNSSFSASTGNWADLSVTLGNIEVRDSIVYRPDNKGTYNPVATRCRSDNYYIGFLFSFSVTFPVGSVFTIQYTKNT